jgi:hypothetical protein
MRDHAYSAAALTPISPILVIFSSAGKFSILWPVVLSHFWRAK